MPMADVETSQRLDSQYAVAAVVDEETPSKLRGEIYVGNN